MGSLNKIADPAGLFSSPSSGASQDSVDAANAAQAAAQADANRIAAEQAQHQQELNNINKNYATDLSTDNRPMIQSGGTASDAAAVDNPDQKRRRPGGTGLSSTLGIST